MFSGTELMELLIQIIVSLMIGTLIVIPALAIWNFIRKRKIRKKVPIELKVKGGFKKNDTTITLEGKKDQRTRNGYPVANLNFLRDYTERKQFEGRGFRSDAAIESSVIKGELSDSSIKPERANTRIAWQD